MVRVRVRVRVGVREVGSNRVRVSVRVRVRVNTNMLKPEGAAVGAALVGWRGQAEGEGGDSARSVWGATS